MNPMNPIYKDLENKRIVILGFGREGKSTYNFIRKELKATELTIADKGLEIKDDELLQDDKYVSFKLGEEYQQNLDQFDLIIKSPGVLLEENVDTSKITSQTDLFFKYYNKNIIGVTGTKGKTTTVTLTTHIMKNAGLDVVLAGNVGLPVFDQLENIKEGTIVIYELSSFQLEFVHNSPHIAVMTNMFMDHMSFHKTFENYRNAKANIVKYQTEKDFFIYNMDNEVASSIAQDTKVKSKKLGVSQSIFEDIEATVYDDYIIHKDVKIYNLNKERSLIGRHNNYNIMMAIVICKLFNVDNEIIRNAIGTYIPEPHRLEYVGTYDGVKYYNDSQATIPEPTIEGIVALKDVETLIVGGCSKGVDFSQIIEFLSESDVKNILCVYETGKEIYDGLTKIEKAGIQYLSGLEEAVKVAKEVTEKGKMCLMSPAAASFGAFKDYKERGEKFRELVKN